MQQLVRANRGTMWMMFAELGLRDLSRGAHHEDVAGIGGGSFLVYSFLNDLTRR